MVISSSKLTGSAPRHASPRGTFFLPRPRTGFVRLCFHLGPTRYSRRSTASEPGEKDAPGGTSTLAVVLGRTSTHLDKPSGKRALCNRSQENQSSSRGHVACDKTLPASDSLLLALLRLTTTFPLHIGVFGSINLQTFESPSNSKPWRYRARRREARRAIRAIKLFREARTCRCLT